MVEKEDCNVIDNLNEVNFEFLLRGCVPVITLQHADESIGHRVFYEFFFFVFLSLFLYFPIHFFSL